MSEITVDAFLEHYGVKGMKWGVRRANRRDARTERLKNGSATLRDKLIREADLDGGRTQAIRKGEIKKPNKKAIKIAAVVVGAAAVASIISTSGGKSHKDILDGKPFFAASGPNGSIRVGSAKGGMEMSVETLNMLVSSLNKKG